MAVEYLFGAKVSLSEIGWNAWMDFRGEDMNIGILRINRLNT